jgi:NADH-quinone oxidoreductase subunit J
VTWGGAVFAISTVTALLGALAAVGMRNIFHNILGFAVAMLGVSGIFLTLGADFLAFVFVLVYVGAVAIAMVYAVMLSQPLDLPPRPRSVPKILGAALLGAGGAAAIWGVFRSAPWNAPGAPLKDAAAAAGFRFLTDYVLAFELISVLLVVAMMGAVMIARRRTPAEGR